jgi:lipopolysaccharide transport system ATP-binding protein
MKPIIEINNLSKKYRLGNRQPYYSFRDTLADLLRNPLKNIKQNQFWALKEVSFKVEKGEILGIIGKNGAGKTTLLKLLSRITPPTLGEIILRGRIASLLEVGTGFHPELTGRENIFLNGAILGMKRKEIKSKFAQIVEFAEIEKFIDTPVKHYSSGMYTRLAFSVAAHLEPEILLIDEVLAVGDAQFQKKCLGKIGDVSKSGRTVLFVSHNLYAIRQLCTRCLLLDHGKIVSQGKTAKVLEFYLTKIVQNGDNRAEISFKENHNKEFQISTVRLISDDGHIMHDFSCDQVVNVEINCIVWNPVPGLYGYLSITNKEGTEILVSDTFDSPPNQVDSLSEGNYRLRVRIPPRILGHGEYSINIAFTSPQAKQGFYVDSAENILNFRLSDENSERGNKRGGFLSTLLKWELTKV